MKTKRSERKKVTKAVLISALLLGGSTFAFQGITQAAVGSEYKKTTVIPTSYPNHENQHAEPAETGLPEGYKKANYTISTIDLDYYKNQTPTSKDMPKEEAAEIGAQAVWKIFGVSLDGQVIEMGYDVGN